MNEINFQPNEFVIASQCDALHAFLKAHGEACTITLRDELGIAQPAARVHDLRHKRGVAIETKRGCAYDAQGRPHSTAVYALVGGAQ